jgi:hypothetical protein
MLARDGFFYAVLRSGVRSSWLIRSGRTTGFHDLGYRSSGRQNSRQPNPRRKHAKYINTRSGRLRLAVIADNSAASIEAFVKGQREAGNHASDGWPRILSRVECLSARSARRRRHGRSRRPSVKLSRFLAAQAMGARHISRPPPQAHRHISQRIRVSLQPTLLPLCFVRNPARLASHHGPTTYRDIVNRDNPKKSSTAIQ